MSPFILSDYLALGLAYKRLTIGNNCMGTTSAGSPGSQTISINIDNKSPVSESVYEELLSRVLSSEMEAGARITIDAIGRELGVSQTPIREALQRLAVERVVVHHHLSGYRVAPKITRDQFEHLVEMRLALEPMAARNACENMPKEMLGELEQLNIEMGKVLGESDSGRGYAAFSRLDAEMHDLIALGAGNTYVRDALNRLHTHAHLFRLANYAQITTRAVDEHAVILTALQRRDPGDAALTMHNHIKLSAERFRTSFTER